MTHGKSGARLRAPSFQKVQTKSKVVFILFRYGARSTVHFRTRGFSSLMVLEASVVSDAVHV
jgi:hypothetical protein